MFSIGSCFSANIDFGFAVSVVASDVSDRPQLQMNSVTNKRGIIVFILIYLFIKQISANPEIIIPYKKEKAGSDDPAL